MCSLLQLIGKRWRTRTRCISWTHPRCFTHLAPPTARTFVWQQHCGWTTADRILSIFIRRKQIFLPIIWATTRLLSSFFRQHTEIRHARISLLSANPVAGPGRPGLCVRAGWGSRPASDRASGLSDPTPWDRPRPEDSPGVRRGALQPRLQRHAPPQSQPLHLGHQTGTASTGLWALGLAFVHLRNLLCLLFSTHCAIWARNVSNEYSSSTMRRWLLRHKNCRWLLKLRQVNRSLARQWPEVKHQEK